MEDQEMFRDNDKIIGKVHNLNTKELDSMIESDDEDSFDMIDYIDYNKSQIVMMN